MERVMRLAAKLVATEPYYPDGGEAVIDLDAIKARSDEIEAILDGLPEIVDGERPARALIRDVRDLIAEVERLRALVESLKNQRMGNMVKGGGR